MTIGRPRSAAPKRTSLVKVLVTPELHGLIVTAADREGRTVSDWGQRLFEREVALLHTGPTSGRSAPSRGNKLENASRSRRITRR